ncbi:adenylyltransferase/cytidyltransferase family protein [Patescibacteria group bacterium]|nr:adenylyltransferase/cytidyltransferase family protein [Patescibacteria group bacterium]
MEEQRQYSNTKRPKRIAVFGIFDGIHDGHRDFFRQAREYGDELIVIVGRDKIAQKFKNKTPKHSEKERVDLVAKENFVDSVILGDEELSTYAVFNGLDPDVVCLGYDQEALGKDLQNWVQQNKKHIQFYNLKPYRSDTFHNSLREQ